MPEPSSAQANRFYTREFFADCASRLGRSGVLGLRLHTAENLWTPAQIERVRSIEASLRAHFEHVLVVPGTPTLLLASNSPLGSEPELLVARLESRGVASRMVTPVFIRYVMTNDRLEAVRRELGEAASTPPNTDARPVSFRYAMVLWLGQFWPRLAAADLASLWAPRWLGWQLWASLSGVVAGLLDSSSPTRFGALSRTRYSGSRGPRSSRRCAAVAQSRCASRAARGGSALMRRVQLRWTVTSPARVGNPMSNCDDWLSPQSPQEAEDGKSRSRHRRLKGLADVATTEVAPGRIANSAAELVAALAMTEVQCIVLEASGGYETLALEHLYAAGFAVVLIQPLRARHFARALGQHAKTDAIDAIVLARMAQLVVDEAPRWEPVAAPLADLKTLIDRRQQLLLQRCVAARVEARARAAKSAARMTRL